MSKFTAVCPVEITLDRSGEPQCSGQWQQQIVVAPFDPSEIQPDVAFSLFMGGFLIFLTPWAAAFGARQILNMIRR